MVILLIVTVFVLVRNHHRYTVEGFESAASPPDFGVKRNVDTVYDKFYTGIYDSLVLSESKNHFEMTSLMKTATFGKTSVLLDIGSGTGHHVNLFSKDAYRTVGLDLSPAMIARAKRNYPKEEYLLGDATDSLMFQESQFSHVTCFYFTIYYIQDKRRFFANCFNWIHPGGHLMLHLVDRDTFDPILPAGSPFVLVPPQKYAKKRVMDTSVKFDTFKYSSKFELKGDRATFHETFEDDATDSIRKNEHHMEMEPHEYILRIAQAEGFILTKKTDMGQCGYDNQYLYTLQRTT